MLQEWFARGLNCETEPVLLFPGYPFRAVVYIADRRLICVARLLDRGNGPVVRRYRNVLISRSLDIRIFVSSWFFLLDSRIVALRRNGIYIRILLSLNTRHTIASPQLFIDFYAQAPCRTHETKREKTGSE